MLRQRLIYGFALAGVIAALLLLDGYLASLPAAPPAAGVRAWAANGAICAFLLGTFVWLAAAELVRLATGLGLHLSARLTELGCALLATGPYAAHHAQQCGIQTQGWEALLLALLLAAALLVQAVKHRSQGAIASVGATMLIVLYIGGLSQFLTRLRMELGGRTGTAVLLLSIFVLKMTDVGAYFTGRFLGRRRLIPWLSPNKTWEGFWGGIATGALVATIVGSVLHAHHLLPSVSGYAPFAVIALCFGVLMSVLSVLGDLSASLLKRDAAVKDSGSAVPGFGGVLDVLDSVLIAAPVAWLFWTALARAG